MGIVVAEELLRIVPSGTHDWEKFISPVELERLLESSKSLWLPYRKEHTQDEVVSPVNDAQQIMKFSVTIKMNLVNTSIRNLFFFSKKRDFQLLIGSLRELDLNQE